MALMEVKAWEEEVVIPTYGVGEPDKNPVFLEKRVYQGSSGKVYPYPIIEKIFDEKEDKTYRAVFLENEYIKVMILPELGGRIQRAYDKTNGYDFVYYNHVIKPALVGLLGPWISGGIEFNWPQHHRPTTFMPVDHIIRENPDGSKTVFVHDVDQMYGTKGIAGFTLYPDKAYIEIRGQLYNRTPLPQTFLWWANPAVAVNENTQSIFPPDVHAVMDHGKRDVSRFPIATGVYYKKDYSQGVDISRYKNIPVPTSYMAEKSEFDFVGGYDYGVQAGILHVADHHISPGKKQWTWGCGDFGKAWDRNLTDEDGPYIELMTGVFTDNQPDFTWLKPYEEKVFTQYFMPYKAVGEVKNASQEAVLNLVLKDKTAEMIVYASSEQKDASVSLYLKGEKIFRCKTDLSPTKVYQTKIPVDYEREPDVTMVVEDSRGHVLLTYTPLEKTMEKLPEPAKAALDPEKILTNEELYLTGLHIEQYRHATYEPDHYYLEGLKRDPGDSRIHNAYGCLLIRRGQFKEGEKHFRAAIRRLTWKNPNPYNSEAYYNLGLALFYQKDYDGAYDAFYKAAWCREQQELAYYYLAAISCRKGEYGKGLELIERSLIRNSHNIKGRGLRAVLAGKLGQTEKALEYIEENLSIDPFDYVSRWERCRIFGKEEGGWNETSVLMRDNSDTYLMTARDYMEWGCYQEAAGLLRECHGKSPLLAYYEGYGWLKSGCPDGEQMAHACLKRAAQTAPDWCFPNKLEDIEVLKEAMDRNVRDAKAPYYLGNLYYDKKQYDLAIELWEQSRQMDDTFPTVFRNLALSAYNKKKDPEKARELMEKAFSLNKKDSRIFLELDQLYKKIGISHKKRLGFYESYPEVFRERDDLVIEYVTLKNLTGKHEEAYQLLMNRRFHPWEGGEGKATGQYVACLLELAKEEIGRGNYQQAKELLLKALSYPENLGEGKLEGAKDNHLHYYLGFTEEKLGNQEAARLEYQKATLGDQQPAGMMYYNDQPADMILYQGLAWKKLGEYGKANASFYRLIDYGEQHLSDEVKIEYFAVSLPELSIFDQDLTKRNQAHCWFLIGMGRMGTGEKESAREAFKKALDLDPNHLNGTLYLRDLEPPKR